MSHDHDHSPTPRLIERHCDVAIVGGSAAGLAAALQLVRQRRSVIVIDAGEPRNAPAAHMHGYIGFDGESPSELIRRAREEVRSYGGQVLSGRVTDVARADDEHFRLELTGGHAVVTRRVIAATGLVDDLPDIDGLAEQWGRGVVHCPFCHGYELRDGQLVHIVVQPRGLHSAVLWAQLTDRLTIVLHDDVEVDESELDGLRARGIDVLRGHVQRIVTGPNDEIASVEVADHEPLPADAVTVVPRTSARAEPFASLGLHPTPHPSGTGDRLEVDAAGQTSVPGVYAAGNVADASEHVSQAAADGGRVGTVVSFSLAEEDTRAAVRRSGERADWEARYSGDQVWSGNPNGTLVDEISGLSPGRALDIGAGECADAIWLAEQGWKATASDISQHALDRGAAEADRRGLTLDTQCVDANAPDAYEPGAFDLVTAMYASIPRTADSRGVRNLLNAVAPGGTLLVVSHDLEPMRAPVDTTKSSRMFDPDSYVRVEDIGAALAESPDWEIELHDKRPRPPGAASASHHVDDVVLRARRRR